MYVGHTQCIDAPSLSKKKKKDWTPKTIMTLPRCPLQKARNQLEHAIVLWGSGHLRVGTCCYLIWGLGGLLGRAESSKKITRFQPTIPPMHPEPLSMWKELWPSPHTYFLLPGKRIPSAWCIITSPQISNVAVWLDISPLSITTCRLARQPRLSHKRTAIRGLAGLEVAWRHNQKSTTTFGYIGSHKKVTITRSW